MYWGDHLSIWDQDSGKRDEFLANCSLIPTSAKSNIDVLCRGIKDQLDRNKSIYIILVPYTGKSDKRTLTSKAASSELIAVPLLVAIAPGDFLGLFLGRPRYTNQKPARAIGVPISNL
jgi:hypothetical protein